MSTTTTIPRSYRYAQIHAGWEIGERENIAISNFDEHVAIGCVPSV